jgi:Tfp pilus assembly protein PilX
MKHNLHKAQKGSMLIMVVMLMFIVALMMGPLLDLISQELHYGPARVDQEEAFQIAEAGINYYQWHLAHHPNDYQDGTTTPSPYVHSYTDYDTQTSLGKFSLVITPPSSNTSIVTVQSTGWTLKNPNQKRTITATFGVPSLAQYSFLSNDIVWIGSGEQISGKLQSNNGVRFDGIGNAPIMSAKATYSCPSSQGNPCPATKNGVWGNPPPGVSAFWQFPVPVVDFSALTANLATMKAAAQSSGIYLSPSSAQGYSLVFNAGGTVSVYKVTSLRANPSGWDVNHVAHNEYTDYNGRTLQYTKPIPNNGIIYVEDTTWVEGVVNGRVMVAAATLPYNAGTAPTIYIPNNITYLAKDGNSVLGLLAQKNVVVTNHAPSTLEIDAALIAQNGSAQFYNYAGNIKTLITIFGSIMTYGQWTWTWVDGGGNVTAGYTTTKDVYDSNLLYKPPPSFPLSSEGYQQISWTSN